jgi:iron complex outermembrane receptor protein
MPTLLARRLLLPALLVHAYAAPAHAAEAKLTTGPVVVTATRIEQSGFDLPASIDSLNKQQLQDGQLQVNLSESLARIPGIVAQNRQNYAQDLQISSRGFGARSSFGVRGLRLYADGIPATMPDGQGQVSHFDLGSAARVEVMRGPFSALYGNSSGGVIALFSEDGAPGTTVEPSLAVGSYGTERLAAKVSGDTGSMNYVVNGARFRTDGYRDHSAAKRETLNAKLKWKLAADTGLTVPATMPTRARPPQPPIPSIPARVRASSNWASYWRKKSALATRQPSPFIAVIAMRSSIRRFPRRRRRRRAIRAE